MGVDCNLYLQDGVRVRHVAEAMAIAAGCIPSWEEQRRWIKVEGMEIRVCEKVPEMVTIHLEGPYPQMAYYFFESESGGRSLSARSTPQFIAIATKVAECFGGTLVYQDCDDRGTYFRPYPNPSPSTGEEWRVLQERLFNIKPITASDIAIAARVSAYDRKAA